MNEGLLYVTGWEIICLLIFLLAGWLLALGIHAIPPTLLFPFG